MGKSKEIVLVVAGLLLLLWSAKTSWAAAASETDEVNQLKQQLTEQTQKLQQMQERLAQLEARQRIKEKSLTEKIQEVEAKAEEKAGLGATDFRAFWKEGLRLETPDGEFKMKIGGRIMHDWSWISEDDDIKADVGEQPDGTEFRRARLYTSGQIYDNVEFKLQLDLAGGDADLKDTYLGLTDFPIGKLRFGHFKEPFSLEELTSSKYITFMERALPNALAPGRNAGIMLQGTALEASDPRMTWAAGIFRDVDDYGEGQDDGGYNVTGRLTYLPWYRNKGASLLHLGAAYSMRNPNAETARYRARPEAHLTDRFVDTGSFTSDDADLFGLEAAWVSGPLSVQGEYMFADADVASSANFDGYYIQGSYFLTGEHRKYKTSSGAFSRVKPKKNFSFGGGGPGAWELAFRYSGLDLDDNDIAGGELDNWTAGVNWYLNPNMRLMWNYVHSDKDDVGKADMLLMRFQIDF